eukprot:g19199.t1
MWELADPIESGGDHICSKWLLEELRLRVDELESELQTLRHIRKGEKYLDALFQEAVTPGYWSGRGKDPVVVVHAGTNYIGKTRKED